MKVGDTIMIRPSINAKGRTKNRLREHGAGGFIVKQISAKTGCLEHRPALLLQSIERNSSGGEVWHGWLAREEIEIEMNIIP